MFRYLVKLLVRAVALTLLLACSLAAFLDCDKRWREDSEQTYKRQQANIKRFMDEQAQQRFEREHRLARYVFEPYKSAQGRPNGVLVVPRSKLQHYIGLIEADPLCLDPDIKVVVDSAVLPDQPVVEGRVFVIRRGGLVPTSKSDPGFVGDFRLGSIEQANKPVSHIMDLTPTFKQLVTHTEWFGQSKPFQIVVVGVGKGSLEPVLTDVEFKSIFIEVR